MRLGRRAVLAGASAWPFQGQGATPQTIRIGVLTDFSGPYAHIGGALSVACVRQAVAEFGAAPFAVEVISADHRNDPAEGARIADGWFASGQAHLVIDVPNSAVALAVAEVARARNRVYINSGAGTTKLTGGACAPTTVHWTFDSWMLARSTGGALVGRGGSTWYIIGADYEFGRQLATDLGQLVVASGGRIQGASFYPFPATKDFSPYIAEAQASGAQILALANAGDDTVACIRQANQAGAVPAMRIAAMLLQLGDVQRLGLSQAAGLILTETFYWDLNDRTRAFAGRLRKMQKRDDVPGMGQAGCYAGALHFLKACAAQSPIDGAALVARMKSLPSDDDAFGAGSIRADGRALHPAFLFQVKTEAESAEAFDDYRQISVIDAGAAFRPLGQGGCVLAKR